MSLVMAVVLALVVGPPQRDAVPAGQTAPTTPPAPISLAAATALHCEFPSYAATRWVAGVPQTVTGTDTLAFDIESINLKARTARVVAGRGSALVSATSSQTGLNVIEQTGIGNFIITTVFSAGRQDDRLLAVHSRHLGDLIDLPTPSQYVGSCTIVR